MKLLSLKSTLFILGIIGVTAFIIFMVWFGQSFSPGTTGNIMLYRSNKSKNFINQQFHALLVEYPQYKLQSQHLVYTVKSGLSKGPLSAKMQMALDSTEFYFYIQERNTIFWAGLSGDAEGWNRNSSVLALIGVVQPMRNWQFYKNLTQRDREDITRLFEQEILQKVDSVDFRPIGNVY